MRGKGQKDRWEKVPRRITPAYAGKSPAVSRLFSLSRDHPRLCGEKDIVHAISKRNVGSPPPMRGKVYSPKPLSRYDGITPAYAGKSTGVCWCWRNRKDHPLLCGEKLQTLRSRKSVVGITPAYAGKSIIVDKHAGWA